MRVIAATLLMVFVDQLTKYFFYDQKLWSDIFITTLNTGAAWGVGIPV
jgi:lipoprotein signal peptidase